MANTRKDFYEMIKDINTVTMITHSLDGQGLGIRPMTVSDINTDCDLWFFASKESAAAHETIADNRMSITLQDGSYSFYVMNGIAKVSNDRSLIQRLWKEPYKLWFPDGPDDPSICLIYFDSKDGEYWDTQGANKVKFLFEAAKAYVTGEQAKTEDGEQHGTVKFT